MKTNRMDKSFFHIGTSLNGRKNHDTQPFENPSRSIEDVGEELPDEALTLDEFLYHFLCGHNLGDIDVGNCKPDDANDGDDGKNDAHNKNPLFFVIFE